MADEYQFRKEIDALKRAVDNIDVSEYVKSDEVNTQTNKLYSDLDVLSTDLTDFQGTLVGLRGSLIDFNEELINFDETNTNLANDLTKLKDNLHLFLTSVNTFSTHLDELDSNLSQFDDDVFGEEGLDAQLNNLAAVVGDDNSGLVKGLADLDASLVSFDTEVFGEEGLETQLTQLATVVGDNNGGLVKGLNELESSLDGFEGSLTTLSGRLTTLNNTVGDANSGLVKKANDTASSVTQLNTDLNTLNTSLNGVKNTVGDNTKGLVKGLNDLNSSVDSLDSDTDALASRLTTVEGSLSTVSSGLTNTDSDLKKLVYSLEKLSGYLTDFEGSLEDLEDEIADDPNIDTTKLNANMVALFGAISEVKSNVSTVETDMYGNGTSSSPAQGSLLADMSTAKTNISSAQTSIGNVKTDLYGANGTASSPQNNSLKKNLQNVKTTVGDANSGLVKDLNTASSHISTVQTDMYGSNKNPSNPQEGSLVYDLNDLNDTITSDGGLIDQVSDVQDGIGDVNDKIGDTNTSGTILYNVHQVKEVQVPAVQDALYGKNSGGSASNPSANSALGKVNAVKTEMYGANGTSSSPADGSLKKNLTTLKDTTVPAVQTALYGNGTPSAPATNSTMGKINAVRTDMYGSGDATNPQSGSLKHSVNQVKSDINDPNTGLKVQTQDIIDTIGDENTQGTVLYDIDQSKTGVNNLQKKMYKGEDGTGTIANPANGTLIKQTNTAITQIGDANSGLIKDVNTVQDDIGTYTDGRTIANRLDALEVYPYSINLQNSGGRDYVQIRFKDKNGIAYSPATDNEIPITVEIGRNTSTYLINRTSHSGDLHNYNLPQGIPTTAVISVSCLGATKTWVQGYATTSDLSQKQNTIPSFTQKTGQNMYGLIVKTYSDGLNVYLIIGGTLNGHENLPNQGNRAKLGTLSNLDYAPPYEMQTTVHSANAPNWSRFTVYANGDIYFQNGVSSTTHEIHGSFYYPLESRLPTI